MAVTPAHVVVLEETLTGLDQLAPGRRRVRAIDRRTFAERTWEPSPPDRIGDVAVHPSGAVSVAVVDDASLIRIVRLDAALVPRITTPLVDPEAAIAYRLGVVNGAFATVWRSLIEPSVGLTPFLPIGGSFDTFGAIVAWFRPALAVDEKGDAYLAVWANRSRIAVHNLVLGGGLASLPTDPGEHDSDVIVTSIDGGGNRRWSRVVGTKYEDEPYALAASGGKVVVAGRSRRFPGNDNTQWDPWLAALDGAGATLTSRTVPFDALGILLSVGVDQSGAIVAGGSDGWAQNPEGLSILSFGAKLLFTLEGASANPARIAMPVGPRHNEIRSVVVTDAGTWFAGHEDGPLTHSGDAGRAEIHATGVVGFLPR